MEKEILSSFNLIEEAVSRYRSAVSLNAGISSAREGLKNVLFSNVDQILSVYGKFERKDSELEILREKLQVLEDELAKVDEENDSLRKQVRAIGKEQAEKRNSRKKKATPPSEKEG